MKAVVLAGGYATRLWPITKHRPKMFLPIGDRTVVDHVFSELEADDRISEVFVSTNERFADEFRSHLAQSEFEKPVLSVEETTEEDEKFGVIGALAQLIDREEIDDDLLIVAGDNLISFDLGEFISYYEARGNPTLAAYDVGSLKRAQSYGIVELDGDRVVDFQEKPDNPKSSLVSIACYAYPAETLGRLDAYLESGNNPDEPGWFVQWLQARETVHAYTFDEAWFDIGTPESYLDAVSWYLDGDSYVDPSATIEDSTIGENVHVMGNVELHGTNVVDSVIFPGAEIYNCDIRASIIDEDTRVEEMDLGGALIGAHTRLTNGDP